MKVLYVAHYREGTGWGEAARNYILALDSIGIDVVCRPIKLNSSLQQIPSRILELEEKSTKGCNICIQHVLPHYIQYDNRFDKNIAFAIIETKNIKLTSWSSIYEMMDEIWTPSHEYMTEFKNAKYVPHTFNINKYTKEYKKINIKEFNGNFIFYFIGDFNRRKNIPALIKAFHCEFDYNEPVALMIKTYKNGFSNQKITEEIYNICNSIKRSLKMYKNPHQYKSEIILSDYIPEEGIMELHNSCNCFVLPSFGEAWCVPAYEAMALNKPVITTDNIGTKDFLQDYIGAFFVPSTQEPVFGMETDSFPEMYTGRELWQRISQLDLMKAMRDVYEIHTRIGKYSGVKYDGLKIAKEFSYEKVGNIMKELLND